MEFIKSYQVHGKCNFKPTVYVNAFKLWDAKHSCAFSDAAGLDPEDYAEQAKEEIKQHIRKVNMQKCSQDRRNKKNKSEGMPKQLKAKRILNKTSVSKLRALEAARTHGANLKTTTDEKPEGVAEKVANAQVFLFLHSHFQFGLI